MAEPAAPAPGGKKGDGPFKKLSPKQKRYAVVIGAAAVLALIFLLQRRRGYEEDQPPSHRIAAQGAAVEGIPIPATGATDPTAFIGAQSEALTQGLADVGYGLTGVNEGLGFVESAVDRSNDERGDADARIAGMLGEIGTTNSAILQKLKGGGPGKTHRGPAGKPQRPRPKPNRPPQKGQKPGKKPKPPKAQPKPKPPKPKHKPKKKR